MAYKLDKTGNQVRDDLNAVEEKTIYPDASKLNKGLMTDEHVQRLEHVEDESIALTEYEIRMICRKSNN